MNDRIDPKNLHRASDGTIRDYEGNIRNENGYMVAPTNERRARDAQKIQVQKNEAKEQRAQNRAMFKEALKKPADYFICPDFILISDLRVCF